MNKISSWRAADGAVTAHYVAILQPLGLGEWRVLFPDAPECETYGFTVRDATFAAATALARCAREKGPRFPIPRSLRQIEDDTEWLSKNRVDLTKAMVTLVPLHAKPDHT
jgi:hypothetical protein